MKTPTNPLVFLRLVLQAVLPSYAVWRELSPGQGLGGFIRCAQPSQQDVQDPVFVTTHVKVTLFTAMKGLKQIVEHDAVGLAAVGKKFRGVVEFGIVSEDYYLGVKVADGKVEPFRGRAPGRADVTIHFRDVPVTLAVLHNQLDTLAAVGSGEIMVRGNIPLADNLNLAMERISDYFPSTLN